MLAFLPRRRRASPGSAACQPRGPAQAPAFRKLGFPSVPLCSVGLWWPSRPTFLRRIHLCSVLGPEGRMEAHCVLCAASERTAQLPVPGTGCSAPFVQINYTLESTLSFSSLCHYKCPSPTHTRVRMHTLTRLYSDLSHQQGYCTHLHCFPSLPCS